MKNSFEDDEMREEYDIKFLNPRKNPYSNRLKKPVTIDVNQDTINYFKEKSLQSGIPYETLMNLYLTDCAKKQRELIVEWK